MNDLFNFYRNALSGVLSEPLCDEYKNEWRACGNNKEQLVTLAMRQQSIPFLATYSSLNMGLSKEYLLKEFGDYINGYEIRNADSVSGFTYGLYVDWNYDSDLEIDKDVSHIMYTKNATLIVPKTKCPIIYLSNGSDVSLVCDGYNTIKVYMFDNCQLTIEDCDSDCEIIVLRYSDDCAIKKGRYCLSSKIYEHRKELRI